MANVSNVVIGVEKPSTTFIKQVLHFTADNLDRVSVSDAEVAPEQSLPVEERF
jgi:hypothetical protein